MKYSIRFLGFVTLIGFMYSCNQDTERKETENIGTESLPDVPQVSLKNYSEGFKNLIKTDNGLFRGVQLGMKDSEVKKLEDTAQMEEKGTDYIDYMINFQEFENAELSYIFNRESKLSRIEVNIYPKSKGSQDSLYKEFNQYFTSKFGKSISDSSKTPNIQKWENKKMDAYILMEKIDTQKIHDINITFSSLIGQSALLLEDSLQ